MSEDVAVYGTKSLTIPSEFNKEKAKEIVTLAIEKASAISGIYTQDELNDAAILIKDIRKIKTDLESHRKSFVAPINDRLDTINNGFKELSLPLAGALDHVTKHVSSFDNRQRAVAKAAADEERRKLQEFAAAEAKRDEDRLRSEGNETAVVNAAYVPEIVVKTEKLSEQNVAGIASVRTKKYKIIDINSVPREYMMLDEAKVKAERSKHDFEAVSTIAGVEFFFERSVR